MAPAPAAAEAVLQVAPEMREVAREGRAAIRRSVEHIVKSGVRQIIDIGSGLPTGENVHDIAHAIDPSVRVVYVDLDDVVVIHGRALLSSPRTAMIRGDVCDPSPLLNDPELRALIDLGRPVGVLMMYLLHLIPDTAGPQAAVAQLRDALAPGSMLSITHAANDRRPEYVARISAIYARANQPFTPRGKDEIAAFFGDWELEEPGLVNVWPYRTPPPAMNPELLDLGYSSVAVKR
ncbi:SAM-dependent methyltransferase [Actinoplanes sp. NPDC051633]|uniref:SAM-dependent methyltransferase n=1 Tax=Actinoplanes sp. NPDC051633 TaxID=3155670 RepID=UPI003449D136